MRQVWLGEPAPGWVGESRPGQNWDQQEEPNVGLEHLPCFLFLLLFYFSLAMGWDLRWEKEGDVIWQIGPVLRDRSGTEP